MSTTYLLLISLFISSILAIHVSTSKSTSTVDLIASDFSPYCTGSIAECSLAASDDEFGFGEFQLDSETNRRILASRRYISYGALRRNSVPCSRRGASYYNCRRGGQANPYHRGCNRITRCRR